MTDSTFHTAFDRVGSHHAAHRPPPPPPATSGHNSSEAVLPPIMSVVHPVPPPENKSQRDDQRNSFGSSLPPVGNTAPPAPPAPAPAPAPIGSSNAAISSFLPSAARDSPASGEKPEEPKSFGDPKPFAAAEPPKDPKPFDLPKQSEASKPADNFNPVEASKSFEAPKPAEPFKSVDTAAEAPPKPFEVPKPSEAPKPTEPSKPVDLPKPLEHSNAFAAIAKPTEDSKPVAEPQNHEPYKPDGNHEPMTEPAKATETSKLGQDGAGPALAPPKPVEVMSIPQTPVDYRTPAGGTPRPELKIVEEPSEPAKKPDAKSVVLSGVQEPAPTPKVSDSASKPAEPAATSVPDLPKTDATTANPPALATANTGEKRKFEEEPAVLTKTDAPAAAPTSTTAPAESEAPKPKKAKKEKKKPAAPVGQTQRKTRSQGPVAEQAL